MFGEVGHTHNSVDQRLSVASSLFSNQNCIQSPAESFNLLMPICLYHHSGFYSSFFGGLPFGEFWLNLLFSYNQMGLGSAVNLWGKGFYFNNCIRGPSIHAQDFLKILDAQIKPSRGRELKNDMLSGSLDFKTYYEQLGIQVSGLVPNARAKTGDETRVNHSWRFVRRCESYLFLAYFYLFI